MFLRETTSKRKFGAPVKYLELVENHWDREKQRSVTHVVYNFGRIDQLNKETVHALGRKLLSYLAETEPTLPGEVEPGAQRDLGVLYVVEQMWKRLKLDAFFRKELKTHKYEAPIERAILGMVGNRCSEPTSKLSAYEWLKQMAYFPVEQRFDLQHVYRALDFLEAHHDALEEALFWRICTLFNRQVDLIFFDTTSMYFEIDEPETDHLRRYGYSHGGRSDRPQVLIGLAVNQDGLPLASEVFPGNTADVRTVKRMIERTQRFRVNQCIFVSDRGTVSDENLAALTAAGFDYLVGVKFRRVAELQDIELPAARDFTEVKENLKVAELTVGGKRYIACLNPQEARKDRTVRDRWLAHLESLLPAINTGKKPATDVTSHYVMKRFVRQDAEGLWCVNEERIRREERFDGLYLIQTSRQELSAKDAALAYKSLIRVEQAFHYLKSFIELRPCYHWTEQRIKGHVLVCVLAYMMQRLLELQSTATWRHIHTILRQIRAVELTIDGETLLYRAKLSDDANLLFKSLKIKPPLKVLKKI